MDLPYFLRQRTAVIRHLYEEGSKPFLEIKRKIEEGEAPYEPPYFDPDRDDPNEHPFQDEWQRADQASDVLGLMCVSLLSDTLKLYFAELEKEIGFEFTTRKDRVDTFRQGFVMAFKEILQALLGTEYEDCPVDFDMIEQVVLTRNTFLHSEHFHTFSAQHSAHTLEKHPNPFFLTDHQRQLLGGGETQTWSRPNIAVTRDRLMQVIEEIEKMADWILSKDHVLYNWGSQPRPGA